MHKEQWIAVAATLGLSVPFALLAVVAAAWVTENLTGLATALSTAPAWNWPLLARSAWERGPELLAMLIGQGLLLVILLLARGTLLAEKPER
jgi:hypothetical protein